MMVFVCFSRRIEILDWWHMLQYVWQIAAAALGPDSSEASAWVQAQKAALTRSQLRLFFRRILRLYPNPAEAPPEVKQAVAYLWKNRHRMNYAAFRKAGFPISSGTVESAAKTLIQQRMKQAGMRWSRNGAQAMLALRARSSANDGMKSLSDQLRPNIGMPPEGRVRGKAQGRHLRGSNGTGGTWSGWTLSIRHLSPISTPGR